MQNNIEPIVTYEVPGTHPDGTYDIAPVVIRPLDSLGRDFARVFAGTRTLDRTAEVTLDFLGTGKAPEDVPVGGGAGDYEVFDAIRRTVSARLYRGLFDEYSGKFVPPEEMSIVDGIGHLRGAIGQYEPLNESVRLKIGIINGQGQYDIGAELGQDLDRFNEKFWEAEFQVRHARPFFSAKRPVGSGFLDMPVLFSGRSGNPNVTITTLNALADSVAGLAGQSAAAIDHAEDQVRILSREVSVLSDQFNQQLIRAAQIDGSVEAYKAGIKNNKRKALSISQESSPGDVRHQMRIMVEQARGNCEILTQLLERLGNDPKTVVLAASLKPLRDGLLDEVRAAENIINTFSSLYPRAPGYFGD